MASAERPSSVDVVTAHDIGEVLKDVVNRAFHEFFERRGYLPELAP